jgi:hypothetical protein
MTTLQQNNSPIPTSLAPTATLGDPQIAQRPNQDTQTQQVVGAVTRLENKLEQLVESGRFEKKVDAQGNTTYSLKAPDEGANLRSYSITIPADKGGFSEIGSYIRPLSNTSVAQQNDPMLNTKKGETVNIETTAFSSSYGSDDLFGSSSPSEIANAANRVLNELGGETTPPAGNTNKALW